MYQNYKYPTESTKCNNPLWRHWAQINNAMCRADMHMYTVDIKWHAEPLSLPMQPAWLVGYVICLILARPYIIT